MSHAEAQITVDMLVMAVPGRLLQRIGLGITLRSNMRAIAPIHSQMLAGEMTRGDVAMIISASETDMLPGNARVLLLSSDGQLGWVGWDPRRWKLL